MVIVKEAGSYVKCKECGNQHFLGHILYSCDFCETELEKPLITDVITQSGANYKLHFCCWMCVFQKLNYTLISDDYSSAISDFYEEIILPKLIYAEDVPPGQRVEDFWQAMKKVNLC